MIGLCGAQRTGKTTLGRVYSQRTGMKFVQTDVKGTWRRLGLNPQGHYSFTDRMIIQTEILRDLEAVYRTAGLSWITDRTPVDALAYTMADLRGNMLTSDEEKLFQTYTESCLRVCNEHFTTLVQLQPGIEAVPHPESASVSPGFMEHINSLVFGLGLDPRVNAYHYFIHRGTTDLEKRLECVQYAVERSKEKYTLVRQRQIEEGERPAFDH